MAASLEIPPAITVAWISAIYVITAGLAVKLTKKTFKKVAFLTIIQSFEGEVALIVYPVASAVAAVTLMFLILVFYGVYCK